MNLKLFIHGAVIARRIIKEIYSGHRFVYEK